MQPTFSLIYTSVRSALIIPVIQDWIGKASHPEALEVIVAIDANDEKSKVVTEKVQMLQEVKIQWFVQSEPPFNSTKGWNLAVSKATGKVFVQLTDDIAPIQDWDAKLLALEPKGWEDGEHVIKTDDGYVHDIFVLAILTKKRYERFGYLFYPDYPSLFCDTEFGEVAKRDGVVIWAEHLLFEHKHPDCHKRDRDEVDKVHASPERWTQGETLFNFRKRRGFPIDVGPRAVAVTESAPAAPPPLKFCVYVQAVCDDLCLFEVCKRMLEEGVHDFLFSVPDEYWSGRPTPKDDIAEVYAVAEQVRKAGANVECMLHSVKTYRWPGDTRLQVETRVRNDALGYLQKKGFEHILIVDSDELWKRGTLHYVREVLKRWHPTAINCLMLPVVGCPGYPIGGATDVAVIYISSSVSFRECRTPVGEQFRLQMPLVIHFTGTRRTMEETIRKHTDSGHFDDPEYDFKEFIDNVLPHIKPGYAHTYPNGVKGIHFFKRYQIWPEVREWLTEDVKEIPESVWKYLGKPVFVTATN